jgi:hypothetical protein
MTAWQGTSARSYAGHALPGANGSQGEWLAGVNCMSERDESLQRRNKLTEAAKEIINGSMDCLGFFYR